MLLQNKKFWLILIGAQLCGVLYQYSFFSAYAYLPQPYVYNKADTFMDFFHPSYWALQWFGQYSEWKSVYPPINFVFLSVFLKLLGINESLQGGTDAFAIRELYPNLIFLIFFFYLMNAYLAARIVPVDEKHSWQRYAIFFSLVLSPAFLFSFERGNLIIFTLPLIALVLFGRPLSRTLAIALLINIKPYLVMLCGSYAMRKDWYRVFVTAVAGLTIFILTGLYMRVDFFQFFSNLLSFSDGDIYLFSPREVLSFPTSISAFAYAIDVSLYNETLPEAIKGWRWRDISTFISLTHMLLMLFAAAILFVAGCTKTFTLVEICAFFIVFMTNLTLSLGGYSIIVYPLLFFIFANMRYGSILLASVFVINLPLDMIRLTHDSIGRQIPYLSGMEVDIVEGLTMGSLLRPIVNTLLLMILSLSALQSLLEKKRAGK
jgi:hypothetical protein